MGSLMARECTRKRPETIRDTTNHNAPNDAQERHAGPWETGASPSATLGRARAMSESRLTPWVTGDHVSETRGLPGNERRYGHLDGVRFDHYACSVPCAGCEETLGIP